MFLIKEVQDLTKLNGKKVKLTQQTFVTTVQSPNSVGNIFFVGFLFDRASQRINHTAGCYEKGGRLWRDSLGLIISFQQDDLIFKKARD